jgi:arylsulfatase A-like enzyme
MSFIWRQPCSNICLRELGIADNTVVVYTTDNGPEMMTWPDGGSAPLRGEKATNWEGGFRVPTVIRWPGVIKPGTVYNDMFAHMDFLPTFCAAAGDPDVVAKYLEGDQVSNKTYKAHLDGYNLMPFFKDEVNESPRRGFSVAWALDSRS